MAAVSPHRLALSFHMARPKPSHRGLVSGFWHKPAPHLALANAQPPRRLHLINPRPPPLRIAPHRHFTRHTRNRARPLGFGHLDQTPLAPPRTCHWKAASPPPQLPHHHTSPPHHSTLPFHTAHPKSSTPLGFVHLDQPPSPRLAHATGRPHHHHHIYHTTTPPLPTILHCRFTRHTRNRARPLGFGHLDPTPLHPALRIRRDGRTTTLHTFPNHLPHGTFETEHARSVSFFYSVF